MPPWPSASGLAGRRPPALGLSVSGASGEPSPTTPPYNPQGHQLHYLLSVASAALGEAAEAKPEPCAARQLTHLAVQPGPSRLMLAWSTAVAAHSSALLGAAASHALPSRGLLSGGGACGGLQSLAQLQLRPAPTSAGQPSASAALLPSLHFTAHAPSSSSHSWVRQGLG